MYNNIEILTQPVSIRSEDQVDLTKNKTKNMENNPTQIYWSFNKEKKLWNVTCEVTNKLPARLYTGIYNNMADQWFFEEKKIKTDKLINIPGSKADIILKEIELFWAKEDNFRKYGFLQRRGYLLYGPPGSGKTAIVEQVLAKVIELDGIGFICRNPVSLSRTLQYYRSIDQNRKIVCLFEDLDSIIDNCGDDELLSYLDGENQIDKVINIATTNYPNKLDKRIINRPRRFDVIINVPFPEEHLRVAYFKEKLKINGKELAEWVKLTKGFSFAGCADLIIHVKCLNEDLTEAAAKVRSLLYDKIDEVKFE